MIEDDYLRHAHTGPPKPSARVSLHYDVNNDTWSWTVDLFHAPDGCERYLESSTQPDSCGGWLDKTQAERSARRTATDMLQRAKKRLENQDTMFVLTLDDVA